MIISRNPYTEEILKEYEEFDDKKINQKLDLSSKAFKSFKEVSLNQRKNLLKKLLDNFNKEKEFHATLITKEMGRPILQSISEIEKCIGIGEYYLEKIDSILQEELIDTEYKKSYVKYEPIGPILAVMPWNFPYSQILRFAFPTILSGNVVVLKHASNVPQCALAIEKLFLDAGFEEGIFQTLLIGSSKVEDIIRNKNIVAVTLTGSEGAGSSVASIAGSDIKRTVMELGGNDAFIVLEDADLDLAVKHAASSRLKNTGQACNAAKRFIVDKNIHDKFVTELANTFSKLKIGDPMDKNTDIGPIAMEKSREDIAAQVSKSIEKGAKIIIGGRTLAQKGFFYEPTILTNVKPGIPAFDEEIFGPVASIIFFETIEEAISLANNSRYGLGSTIWTKDLKKAEEIIPKIEAGSVFVNTPFSSDVRLPFGGIKNSGYGKELSHFGPREFLNAKSIVIN